VNGNLISLANLVVLVGIGASGAVAWDRLNAAGNQNIGAK